MIDVGMVSGSKEAAQPVIFAKSWVYVHTDIQKVPLTDEEGNEIEPTEENTVTESYTYHEYKYTYQEFSQLQYDENLKLKENLSNAQLALLELYEGMDA